MKNPFFRGSAAAALLIVISVTGAEAQLTLTSPSCTAWTQADAGYTRCAGAFAGNDSNQDVAGWLSTNWGFTTTGTPAKSDEKDSLFLNNPGDATGTLNFSGAGISGIFVLSLKASNQFSLYQFDTHGETWTSLSYSTIGVSVNGNSNGKGRFRSNGFGQAQGLSHASLYMGPTTPTTVTPEPVSMALLGTGLAGLGALSWRRRKKDGELV